MPSHPSRRKRASRSAGCRSTCQTAHRSLRREDLFIEAGERALVTGPSGCGKSTFFRAIAGLWPFGTGTVKVPRGAKLMMLPQRPYFPVDSLEAAVSYPSEPGEFESARITQVLESVGLPALAQRLSDEVHWNQVLSLGEQQRLGIARAILQAPDYLFLDEATASLDEASEAKLYLLLQEVLPRTTIVSIGHRSTLFAFHDRHLSFCPRADITASVKPCSRNRRKISGTPEGAGLTSCASAVWRDAGSARRAARRQSAAGRAVPGKAPCSRPDDDQVLAVARRSCKLDPLSKCSTKIRPMLRVQATAAMDETARPTRPLPGTT